MAYDVFSGRQTETSWAREGGESSVIVGSWARQKAWDMLKSRVPWKTVAIVGAIAAGLFVIPRVVKMMERKSDARKTRREFESWGEDETTLDVRRPSMAELQRKRRAA